MKRSAAQRIRVLARDGFACRQCGLYDPTGKQLEHDHRIELWIGDGLAHGDDLKDYLQSDENCVTLCIECHAKKTAKQAGVRAKVKRLEKKRTGQMKEKPKRAWQSAPLPGSKRSKWKRGFDGKVTHRDEES